MKARILLLGSLSGLLLACPSSTPTSNEDTVDPTDATTTDPSVGSSSDTTEGSLTSADTSTVTTEDPTTESSSGDSFVDRSAADLRRRSRRWG